MPDIREDLFEDFDFNMPTIDDNKSMYRNETPQNVAIEEKTMPRILSDDEINSLAKSGCEKLRQIYKEMNSIFLEREDIIKYAIYALSIGKTMLMVGPPGTGKSQLVYELCSRITGGKYFQWLLNKTSDPSELLGPYSIKGMEEDRFVRIPNGKLPDAHIAFLDELFKCNEPTLNILLPIINEKIFYNDGVPVDVPLVSMFAASNEFPEEEELSALYDRLLFRTYVNYIKDPSNKFKMYNNYLNNGAATSTKTMISLEELQCINQASHNIAITKEILTKYLSIIKAIENKCNIKISDRRQNEALRALQSSAILHDRQMVTEEDFNVLESILWEKEDDIKEVQMIISDVVDKIKKQLLDFKITYEKIKKDIQYERDKNGDNMPIAESILNANASISQIMKKIDKLLAEARSSNAKPESISKMIEFKTEMGNFMAPLIKSLVGSKTVC